MQKEKLRWPKAAFMKIISGALGGRKLKSAADCGLRPAMGKTREALFSLLEARGLHWAGLSALDLFAGSGSLGFECLSRGSRTVDFVENGHKACQCLRENAETLGLAGRAHIRKQDVLRFLHDPPRQNYGLIFLDPPYGKDLVRKTFIQLRKGGWLENRPVIVAEIEKSLSTEFSEMPEMPQTRIFGQTALHIWNLP